MKLTNKKNSPLSEVIIVAAIIGFVSGVVGQIVADVYIDPFAGSSTGLPVVAQDGVTIPELKRVKRFLGIQQDFEVNNAVNLTLPALAALYPARTSQALTATNQVYRPRERLGTAVILTSDGWLLTHQSAVLSTASADLAVVIGNQTFEVSQIISDAMAGVTFIKISATNLPVVVLGDSGELFSGQLVIAINASGEVAVTNVLDPESLAGSLADGVAVSTEQFSRRVLVGTTDAVDPGSVLVNLAGELVGIVDGKNSVTAVAVNQFRPVILDILRSGIVKRPYFGVTYIDLARVAGITNQPNRGALVVETPLRNSPAADADIQPGDIIVSINDQAIDQQNGLTEIIQQYQSGDDIPVTVQRGTAQFSSDVTLSIQPE